MSGASVTVLLLTPSEAVTAVPSRAAAGVVAEGVTMRRRCRWRKQQQQQQSRETINCTPTAHTAARCKHLNESDLWMRSSPQKSSYTRSAQVITWAGAVRVCVECPSSAARSLPPSLPSLASPWLPSSATRWPCQLLPSQVQSLKGEKEGRKATNPRARGGERGGRR